MDESLESNEGGSGCNILILSSIEHFHYRFVISFGSFLRLCPKQDTFTSSQGIPIGPNSRYIPQRRGPDTPKGAGSSDGCSRRVRDRRLTHSRKNRESRSQEGVSKCCYIPQHQCITRCVIDGPERGRVPYGDHASVPSKHTELYDKFDGSKADSYPDALGRMH